MARIFTFRGKQPEELKTLTMEQYLPMLRSRERRAIKRMGVQYKELIAKAEEVRKSGGTDTIRTHTREAVILPQWIGMKFAVHNGKDFKEFTIQAEHLGHRLGDFSHTTKHVVHSAPGIRATRGSKFLAVK